MGGALGCRIVRGEFHKRLVKLLADRIAAGVCTQESLAKRVGMHQTTVSGILRRDAGTFDLDEAAAALDHVGAGSLATFLAGVPPADPTPATRLAARLVERPELLQLLEDLLPVPKPRLAELIELIGGLSRVATGRRATETRAHSSGRRAAPRTTAAPAKRR